MKSRTRGILRSKKVTTPEAPPNNRSQATAVELGGAMPTRDRRSVIAGPCAAMWQRHRRRSWTFWLLLLGFVPGAPLLAVWLGRLFHSESLFLPTTLGWMAAVGIAGACRSSLRCPRCGERFFRKGRQYRNEFARKCVNCGFPKWALADETRVD